MKQIPLRATVALIALLSFNIDLRAEVKTHPDTVTVGMYITSIHNINLRDREYNITFWLWLKYKNKKFNFLKYLEIPNAKSFTSEFVQSDSSGANVSILMKVQCLMKDSWRMEDFPFDDQRLWLTIENSQYDASALVFEPETGPIPFDSRMKYYLAGWKIDSCMATSGISRYETTFGDLDNPEKETRYSAYKVRINITRIASGLLFWKLFLGMYIAFLIAYVCFHIQPGNFDSRFSLSVGALFAVVGNKYIVESSIPESITFTLVDALHMLTLLFILLTIASTAISFRIEKQKRSAFKFDMIAAHTLLAIYAGLNIYLIWSAMNGA